MGVRLRGPVTALFVLVGAIIFIWYPIKETDLRERRSKYLAERASSEDKKK